MSLSQCNRDFFAANIGKYFKIKDIKSYLSDTWSNLSRISDKSIRRIIKYHLRYNFKIQHLTHIKKSKPEYLRRFNESKFSQIHLEELGYEKNAYLWVLNKFLEPILHIDRYNRQCWNVDY